MNRAERRRQLKEDERLVQNGLSFTRTDADEAIALMRVLRDRLAQSRTAGKIAPLMRFLHDNFGKSSARIPRELSACASGCSHCCHMWTALRAPEALFLKSAIPVLQREEVGAAVEAAHAETGAHSYEERLRMVRPCPLLKNDVCSVYTERPIVCRTTASTDASICARAYRLLSDEDVPQPLVFLNQRTSYALALAGALKHAGYFAGAYELNGALHAALSRPDAEAAWLRGDDLFAGVRQDPGGDPFANPEYMGLYREAFA
jgi:Fe-S-cluster containining protein